MGENAAYKGSIYFDDAALVVDGNVLLSNDFESGKVNACTYTMNQSEKKHTPKVVGFTGKALDVAKKTLTIKAGKKATKQQRCQIQKLHTRPQIRRLQL